MRLNDWKREAEEYRDLDKAVLEEITRMNGNSKEPMRTALEQIVGHTPRKHQGRSRSFVNWQDAYWQLQGIAKRALEEITGPV